MKAESCIFSPSFLGRVSRVYGIPGNLRRVVVRSQYSRCVRSFMPDFSDRNCANVARTPQKKEMPETLFLSPSLQIFLDLPRVRGRVRLELEVHEREGLDSRRLGRSHEALWLRHELHLIIHVLVASPHNACSLSDAK